MKKVYIAASWPNHDLAESIAQMLKGKCEVVSVWHRQDVASKEGYDRPHDMLQAAIRDFDAVRSCDLFVVITGDNLTRGGRHAEFGAALATGKSIIILGPKEHVLHYHPSVMLHMEKWSEEAITKWLDSHLS